MDFECWRMGGVEVISLFVDGANPVAWWGPLGVVLARWAEAVRDAGERDAFGKLLLRPNEKRSDILFSTDYGNSEMWENTPTVGQALAECGGEVLDIQILRVLEA